MLASLRLSHRRRDLFELIAGYCLILIVIWTPGPIQRVLYWLAFAFIVITSALRREPASELGLGWRGLLRSSWIVAAALGTAAMAVAAARFLHTLHHLYGPPPLALHISGYVLWALMQQFILQVFVLMRLLRLGMQRGPAVLLATALFALAHVPNPVLVALTLVWGLASCLLFLRYRNLYTLGLAHGVLGICVAVTVPNHLQHHMRVGFGYFTYHPYRHRREAPITPTATALPTPYPPSHA